MVKKEPKTSSSKICEEIKESSGTKVHPRTVRRVLKNEGYNARVCRKKPFISKVNQKKRLDFAKEFLNHPQSFWNNVLFSDERKFCVYRSDGRVVVWRKAGSELRQKILRTPVKHGGGAVMVWGCMAASGVGELVFIDEIMKKKKLYLKILKENLRKSAENLNLGNDFYFQQDNDPKHTAEMVRLWILYNSPHTLKTPLQSPDINPIEHLWDVLDKRVREHYMTSKRQLKELVQAEWKNTGTDVTRT